MNVLLIGFSPQSAQVLHLLIERYYPTCQATVIERCFGDNLRLCLPSLQTVHESSNAMIIHLDGVGMIRYSPDGMQALRQFVGERAALFISKGDQLAWQQASVFADDVVFFTKSSYTKDEMLQALARLQTAVARLGKSDGQLTKLSGANPTVNPNSDGFGADSLGAERHQGGAMDGVAWQSSEYIAMVAHQASFLHDLLDKCIAIKKNALLHELLDVSLIKYPQKLTAGSQVFYLYGERNLALVANISRLIDYCQMTTNFQVLSNVLMVERISLDEFEKIERQAGQNNYEKYALSTLLWQLYAYILPKEIDIASDELLLKMRYMPNFAQMYDVPEYIRALASSCLIAPRSLKQLHQSMAGVQISRHQLNRFFVLAVLSGVADTAVLEASFRQMNRNAEKPQQAVNAGVAKAQKTGFLQRLLAKLRYK